MQTDNTLVFNKTKSAEAEIKVKSGSEFNIKIAGNPTTGYSWYLNNEDELKNGGVQPTNLDETKSADYDQNDAPMGMVGVPGKFNFKFKLDEGKTNVPEIQFSYKRPWEKNDGIYLIKVKVVVE
jgi:predicted secreted protein